MKKLTPSRMKTAKKQRIKIARDNWEKKHPIKNKIESFGESLNGILGRNK